MTRGGQKAADQAPGASAGSRSCEAPEGAFLQMKTRVKHVEFINRRDGEIR
jgi:hypothetical protein